jgi:predicted RNase H-like HicB family nuclease
MRRSKSGSKTKVVFEQDGSGWRVSAAELKGTDVWGRSLSEARRKVKKALGGKKADFAEDVRLPGAAKKEIERYAATRAEAQKALDALRSSTRGVVDTLTRKHGISLRDASSLLGLSRERVRQLTV